MTSILVPEVLHEEFHNMPCILEESEIQGMKFRGEFIKLLATVRIATCIRRCTCISQYIVQQDNLVSYVSCINPHDTITQ